MKCTFNKIKIFSGVTLALEKSFQFIHSNTHLNPCEKVPLNQIKIGVHVCFVQVKILKLVWRSGRPDAPQCVHFPTDICSVIQEGEIKVEKCVHRGTSARRERHTLSLG